MTSTLTRVALGSRIHQTNQYTQQRRVKIQFGELGLVGMALVFGLGTTLGPDIAITRTY